MKLVSYRRNHTPGFGVLVDGGIVDLGRRLGARAASLRDALSPEMLEEVRGYASEKPDFPVAEIEYLPVIPEPRKIICIGLNYKTHVAEAKIDAPDFPIIFLRTARSQVGHEQDLIKPAASDRFDFEGELAVIIGKPGRHIRRDKAFEHVAGYSCYNDGSVRDWQRHTSQWGPGKNFPSTGGFGPWLMTADEAPPPTEFVLRTLLNGQVMQHASVGDLLFDIPALIEYCSTMTELETGDVIVTGTTGGVGVARDPQIFLKPGDVVEIDISPVGILRNMVSAERS